MSDCLKNLPFYRQAREYQYFFVNGILTNPGDIHGWNDRAERAFENAGLIADRYEYKSGAITRFLGQQKRVNDIAEILSEINRRIIYVGHSNGCELFSKLIQKTDLEFDAVHLFAPATWADFDSNGFNEALEDKRIMNLFIYGSKKDNTLKWGNRLTGWLKFSGLGYGDLGYSGVKNVRESVSHRVHFMWKNNMEHSDWFRAWHFEDSMKLCARIEP